MEGGAPPAPGEFGAALTVLGSNRLILGQRCNLGGEANGMDPCSGGGTIIMNGASDILADGIVIGERDEGDLIIGPDARVRSGRLDDEEIFTPQDFRIGSFGPSRGATEPIPVRLEGDGFVQVEGELVANTVYMPESGATGVLRVMPGGVVDIRGIDMRFQPGQASRSSTLEIIGSGGSFTLSAGDILAAHHTATISFTADAAGVTPIIGGGGGDVEGGNLVLDLDDFNFNSSSTMMLIDVQPGVLFGTFANVSFLGDTTADVNYDFDNGDIFLNNFMSTIVPVDGDYNNNGVVDAADYTVWRDSLGTTTVLPNDTTPGIVSQADYDLWKSNFGMSAGSGASLAASAVPEPGTLAAAMLFIACCAATRQLHRTNK
jgi:hypothetical protein